MCSRTPQKRETFLLKPKRREPITAEEGIKRSHGAMGTQSQVQQESGHKENSHDDS
jgi:hypothetical protein